MTVEEMISTHPQAAKVDRDALARCIAECFSCAAACTSCADACLGEATVHELVRCIRLNFDCADLCAATGRVLSRQTAFEPRLARHILEACMQACRICGDECERHAEHHEHCRLCADTCRRCEEACNEVVSTIGTT